MKTTGTLALQQASALRRCGNRAEMHPNPIHIRHKT